MVILCTSRSSLGTQSEWTRAFYSDVIGLKQLEWFERTVKNGSPSWTIIELLQLLEYDVGTWKNGRLDVTPSRTLPLPLLTWL